MCTLSVKVTILGREEVNEEDLQNPTRPGCLTRTPIVRLQGVSNLSSANITTKCREDREGRTYRRKPVPHGGRGDLTRTGVLNDTGYFAPGPADTQVGLVDEILQTNHCNRENTGMSEGQPIIGFKGITPQGAEPSPLSTGNVLLDCV